jgi:hypothetical protein
VLRTAARETVEKRIVEPAAESEQRPFTRSVSTVGTIQMPVGNERVGPSRPAPTELAVRVNMTVRMTGTTPMSAKNAAESELWRLSRIVSKKAVNAAPVESDTQKLSKVVFNGSVLTRKKVTERS